MSESTGAPKDIDRVICIHGTQSTICSDNGSIFTSKLMKKFCQNFGIKQIFSSSFVSKSQGVTERYNQAVQSSLRAFISKAQSNWCFFLQSVIFSLNNTVCSTLGFSPNFLIFGKQTMLPTEASLDVFDKTEFKDEKDMVLHLIMQRDCAQKIASDYLFKTHSDVKKRHDRSLGVTSKYAVADVVYLHIPTLLTPQTSKKLQPTYSGPYLITEITSPYTVKIKRLSDGFVAAKSVNIERLRRPLAGASKTAILKRLERPAMTGKLINPDLIIETKLTSSDLPVLKQRTKALAHGRKARKKI